MNRFKILLAASMVLVGCTPNIKTYTNQYGEVYDYGDCCRYELPEKPIPKPNKPTLQTTLDRYIDEPNIFNAFKVQSASKPHQFQSQLRTEPYITKQLETTALLSYLLYEDGRIVVDQVSPSNRFGEQLSDSTPLPSRSVGKTLTSYLLGHAICEGVIDSLDSRIDDWPMASGTIYDGQRLIDLVNMRAGDQNFAYQNRVLVPEENPRGIRHVPLEQHFRYAKGNASDRRYYNYNDFAVNTVVNYISFKTGYRYKEFVTEFINKKIGNEHPLYILAVDGNRAPPSGTPDNGVHISNFSASRYDFLRIGRAMLYDWQNDTCEGKYLKEIYERRQRKDRPDPRYQRDLRAHNWPNHLYNSYGGYFHTDLYKAPERKIMAMDGFGGQIIVIDFENGRIVVTNAIYNDFNWKRIVRDVMVNGKI